MILDDFPWNAGTFTIWYFLCIYSTQFCDIDGILCFLVSKFAIKGSQEVSNRLAIMFLLYSVEIIMTDFFLALPLQPMILTPSYERKFQRTCQLLETDKKITMGKSGKKLGERRKGKNLLVDSRI